MSNSEYGEPPELKKKERLPTERKGAIHRFVIDGQKCYLRIGEYDDGRIAEIFIDLEKEGSIAHGFGHCFSIAVSIALQHGVAFGHLYSKFYRQDFKPHGITDQREIPTAKSIVDYIFQWLNNRYDEKGFRRKKKLVRKAGLLLKE